MTQKKRHLRLCHEGEDHSRIKFRADDAHPVKPSNRRQKRESEDLEVIKKLVESGKQSLEEALAKMRVMCDNPLMGVECRLALEGEVYLGILLKAITPTYVPFSKLNIMDIMRDGFDDKKDPYRVVVCTPTQVASILEHGTPMVPLFIPASHNARGQQYLTVEAMLEYVSSKSTISVQEYGIKKDRRSAGSITPSNYSGPEAVQIFQQDDGVPVNFLDLDAYKTNAQPLFIADQPNFQCLRTIEANNFAGKRSDVRSAELRNSVQFQLLGKSGAWSMPHCDSHSVMTTVFCDDGKKLWLTYPHLSIAEMIRWMQENVYSPNYPAMNIPLQRGDQLIIPPGRVHAPFSVTDVSMTGTMHWDTRNLRQILNLSILQAQYGGITNEDLAAEFAPKVKEMLRLWKLRAPTWEWGDDDDLQRSSDLLEVSFLKAIPRLQAKIRHRNMSTLYQISNMVQGDRILRDVASQ